MPPGCPRRFGQDGNQGAGGGWSFIREFGQRSEDHRIDRRRYVVTSVGDRPRWAGHLVEQDRFGGDAAKRRSSGKHLIYHTGQAVDVAPAIENFRPGRLFRTHVFRRAERGIRETLGQAPSAHRAGDAEVAYVGVAIRHQNVFRFDVEVDDVIGMRIVEGVCDITGDAVDVLQ